MWYLIWCKFYKEMISFSITLNKVCGFGSIMTDRTYWSNFALALCKEKASRIKFNPAEVYFSCQEKLSLNLVQKPWWHEVYSSVDCRRVHMLSHWIKMFPWITIAFQVKLDYLYFIQSGLPLGQASNCFGYTSANKQVSKLTKQWMFFNWANWKIAWSSDLLTYVCAYTSAKVVTPDQIVALTVIWQHIWNL